MNERTLTVSEAAIAARVTGETVREWIHSRKLAANRMQNGHYRIPASELLRFMNSGRQVEASSKVSTGLEIQR